LGRFVIGQLTHWVEQGTENPRVGSLRAPVTILSLLLRWATLPN